MSRVLLFNKPYGVICQFSRDGLHPTLADYISVADFYPAGRLDTDSEGLLLLTDDGKLQHRVTDPKHKLPKTYWVQVEGVPNETALERLRNGLQLKDGPTLPAQASIMKEPVELWQRDPPVRFRKDIPTSWLQTHYSRRQESPNSTNDGRSRLSYLAFDSVLYWRLVAGRNRARLLVQQEYITINIRMGKCLSVVRCCPCIAKTSPDRQLYRLLTHIYGRGTVVAIVLFRDSRECRGRMKGECMKSVWFGIVFILVYGLFSMKSQAATQVPTANSELRSR